MSDDRFIRGLGGGVFAIWAISCLAQIVTGATAIPDYETPTAVHGMMGSIVGAVVAEIRLRSRRRQLSEEEDVGGS